MQEARVHLAGENETLGSAMGSPESCLDDVRPVAVCLDRSTQACTDPASLREGALERYGDLCVRIWSKRIFQWHSKYFSQVLPFVIPRMVSGPDYDPERRWRRVEDVPFVSARAFAAGFARRVEAACRTDWSALPIVRSVAFKLVAEHTVSTVASFAGKRGSATNTFATDVVAAAKNLFHHLHNGFTGQGGHRVPIAGDRRVCYSRTG